MGFPGGGYLSRLSFIRGGKDKELYQSFQDFAKKSGLNEAIENYGSAPREKKSEFEGSVNYEAKQFQLAHNLSEKKVAEFLRKYSLALVGFNYDPSKAGPIEPKKLVEKQSLQEERAIIPEPGNSLGESEIKDIATESRPDSDAGYNQPKPVAPENDPRNFVNYRPDTMEGRVIENRFKKEYETKIGPKIKELNRKRLLPNKEKFSKELSEMARDFRKKSEEEGLKLSELEISRLLQETYGADLDFLGLETVVPNQGDTEGLYVTVKPSGGVGTLEKTYVALVKTAGKVNDHATRVPMTVERIAADQSLDKKRKQYAEKRDALKENLYVGVNNTIESARGNIEDARELAAKMDEKGINRANLQEKGSGAYQTFRNGYGWLRSRLGRGEEKKDNSIEDLRKEMEKLAKRPT